MSTPTRFKDIAVGQLFQTVLKQGTFIKVSESGKGTTKNNTFFMTGKSPVEVKDNALVIPVEEVIVGIVLGKKK